MVPEPDSLLLGHRLLCSTEWGDSGCRGYSSNGFNGVLSRGVPSVPLQWYHLRNDINGVLWVPLVLLDLEECLPLAQMVCSLYTGSYVLYTASLSNNVSQPKDTLDWGIGTLTTKGIFFYPGGSISTLLHFYIAALLHFYILPYIHCESFSALPCSLLPPTSSRLESSDYESLLEVFQLCASSLCSA